MKKLIIGVLVIILGIIFIPNEKTIIKKELKQKQRNVETKRIYTKELIEIPQQVEQEVKKQEEKKVEQKKQEEKQEQKQEEVKSSYTTRMTSYYPQESSDCTGSGLCSWDFQTNEYGWYTYQGKLVVATATTYLLKEGFSLADGVHTYKYYDEITLNIDGVGYQAIVLDSCGSSMRTDRIDLFVNGANSVKDTMIEVKE